jgi:hypothetical protein
LHEAAIGKWKAQLRDKARNHVGSERGRWRSTAYPLGLIFGTLFIVSFGLAVREWHAFNSMTPAEHLAAAREDLNRRAFDHGLQQLRVIPASAPEAAQAREVESALISLREGAEKEAQVREAEREAQLREAAEERSPQSSAEVTKTEYVRIVQSELQELGYDLRITRSEKQDEIVISSKDFRDTENRVRFLAHLRSQKGPAQRLCSIGFQEVRLTGGGVLGRLEFNEAYSLECWR